MNTSQRLIMQHAIAACYRLTLTYIGVDIHEVYRGDVDPETDEAYVLELLEGARDAWRPIWGSRSKRKLESIP